MTSRLIYEASKHSKGNVEWIKHSDSEWLYCGVVEDFKGNLLSDHINNHLQDETLYVSINRNESFKIKKNETLAVISEIIGTKDFFIWTSTFKNVIEFNRIGVFRKGKSVANKD